MSERIYPCCDNPDCPMCEGSGVVQGPQADAVMDALLALADLERAALAEPQNDAEW